MKKSLLALAALASVASVAHAEDGVQLYGILDAGVVQMTHAGNLDPQFVTNSVPTSANAKATNQGTVMGMMNGGESATRWGIKGSEDLGNGRSAFFQLESGFNLTSGYLATSALAGSSNQMQAADTSLNGQLFGRLAYVGVSDKSLGTLTVGRMNSLMLDIIAGGYDPVNFQMFSPINFSGNYGGGGLTDNGRVDSALKYTKQIGNFKINALYGFGGMSNNNTARNNMQASLGYETGRFGIQVAAQNAHDVSALSVPHGDVGANTLGISGSSPYVTLSSATSNAVDVTYYDTRAYLLTGKYQLSNNVKLLGGYELLQYTSPSSFGNDATLTTIYSYSVTTAISGGNKTLNVFWLGGNYDLNSKTKISAAYYDVALLPGATAYASALSGNDRYASFAIEYALSKRTNVYAAAMDDTKTGGIASGYGVGYPSQFWTYGAGIRHKF